MRTVLTELILSIIAVINQYTKTNKNYHLLANKH